MELPRGLYPVMLTAFDENRNVDGPGTDALVDFYLEKGASGLFAVCLSSEMYELSPAERLVLAERVVARVHKNAGDRIPVVATGTFGGPINAQADFVRRMADTGVSAVVLIPALLAAENEGDDVLRSRIEALMSMTGRTPLGMYECPLPYHRTLSADLVAHLAGTGRFVYMKETTREVAGKNAKLAAARGSCLSIFDACAPTLMESIAAGAAGSSPIAANLFPELFVELQRLVDSGDGDAARKVQDSITGLQSQAAIAYPLGAKLVLAKRGVAILPVARSVQRPLSEEEHSCVRSLLRRYAPEAAS